MSLKPIKVWGAASGPNPWKVILVLEALGLPYEMIASSFGKVKTPEILKLNPNGRYPIMQDPNNNDFVLWESGAILEYIVDQYDTSNKLSYAELNNRYLLKQWLMFQMSGQGPYFGQFSWFAVLHPEDVPSAKARYEKEVYRIMEVLDSALAGSKSGWLVGNKMTYVDLTFVWWNYIMIQLLESLGQGKWDSDRYPHFMKWHTKMTELDAFKRTVEFRSSRVAAEHQQDMEEHYRQQNMTKRALDTVI